MKITKFSSDHSIINISPYNFRVLEYPTSITIKVETELTYKYLCELKFPYEKRGCRDEFIKDRIQDYLDKKRRRLSK